MHLIRHTITLAMLLTLATACTSDRAFDDKEAFSRYVTTLKLTGKTVDSAMQTLAQEGFRCHTQQNQVMCLRDEYNGICKQKQVLTLPSNQDAATLVEVNPEVSLVCL